MSAADILVDFFNADVKFIKRGSGKTPDFLINPEKRLKFLGISSKI